VRLALVAVAAVVCSLAVAVAGLEATTFSLPDEEGDGGKGDVVGVRAVLEEGAGFVQVLFSGRASLEKVAIRGVLVSGAVGSAEPAEWYQFTVANETQAFAAHGTPREVRVLPSSSWNGSVMTLRFERSEPVPSTCTFAVVEAGTFGEGGFGALDVAPRGFASMEDAWPVTECPTDGIFLDDHPSPPPAEKGSPGVGLGLLLAAVVGAAMSRRWLR
jgi:hypothetical protein